MMNYTFYMYWIPSIAFIGRANASAVIFEITRMLWINLYNQLATISFIDSNLNISVFEIRVKSLTQIRLNKINENVIQYWFDIIGKKRLEH